MPTIIRSKRVDLVEQELYAILIMYEFDSCSDLWICEQGKKISIDTLEIGFLNTLNMLQVIIDSTPFMTTAKDSQRKQRFNYLLNMIAYSQIDPEGWEAIRE